MKKAIGRKILKIMALIIYLLAFSSLIALQLICIQGKMEKLIATLLTFLISGATIGVIYLFLYEKEKELTVQLEKDIYQMNFETFRRLALNSELSRREMEVAWLLYRGYGNRQIAEELYISETTVKKHVTHIYEKTQVNGRKHYREKANETKDIIL